MEKLNQTDLEYLLLDAPVIIGQEYGFDKLTDLHNEWIKDMVYGVGDRTLQAHRGSYKTTAVSVALSEIVTIAPNDKTMFMRKTDDDVKEIVEQAKKILASEVMQTIAYSLYGVGIELTKDSANEINTNLAAYDPRGTSQIVAMGIGASLTGKHFDRIFTDDIVNIKDRTSRAERKKTDMAYLELQNVINRGGRIYNTGTPWHKDDTFRYMPEATKYDCYQTGLITPDELQGIKNKLVPSLFAANYELRHIAAEDVIFENPRTGGDPSKVEQGTAHIDAAYSGEDYTAFTICRKIDGVYYVLGKIWRKHVDDCLDEIMSIHASFNAGRISCENNGDKGYLGKDLVKRGARTYVYHEKMNKYVKITSYLKSVWQNVVFVAGTDKEYIDMVCDYNENAEHDDAPDSLASIIREKWDKKDKTAEDVSNLYLL